MAWKDLTPEQQAMDKLVQAANRKIMTIAKQLGTESRAYKQMEEILWGINAKGRQRNPNNLGSQGFIRDKNGVVQISRGRKALTYMDLKQNMAQLRRVMQLPSAAQIKQNIVQGWIDSHTIVNEKGEKVIPKVSAKEKKEIVSQALQDDRDIAQRLESALQELYAIRDNLGVELKAISEISAKSRGLFTSREDLLEMLDMAEKERAREDHEIQQDEFAGW